MAHRLLISPDLQGQIIEDEVANYNELWAKPDSIQVVRIEAYVPVNTPPDAEIAANLSPLIEIEPYRWRRDIPGTQGEFAFSMNRFPLYGLGEDCSNYPKCHTKAIPDPWNAAFTAYTYYVNKWRWHPEAPLAEAGAGSDVNVEFWITVPEETGDDTLVLYGQPTTLGGGDPAAGVPLQKVPGTDGHAWTATVPLPAQEEMEFFVARAGIPGSTGLPRGSCLCLRTIRKSRMD